MRTERPDRGVSRFFLLFGLVLGAGLLLWLGLGLRVGDGGFFDRYLSDVIILTAGVVASFFAASSPRMRRWILSMRTGLIVLVILAVASLIGVIFTQGANPEEYVARFGETGYRILGGLGFLNVFHVWWYKALLFLLIYLVTACSLRRARTILRSAFGSSFRFDEKDLPGQSGREEIKLRRPIAETAETVRSFLSERGYRAASEMRGGERCSLFAARGRLCRLGTLSIHLSLALILAGGYVAVAAGNRYLQWAAEGEIFRVRRAGFEVQVNSFDIVTTEEGRIKDYLADLTVLEAGREVMRRVVEVNKPLKYKGINIYQSSYRRDPRSVEEALFRLEDDEGNVLAERLVLPFREPTPVPGADLTVEVLDYAADFVMDVKTREVASRSAEPFNPAIKVRYETSGGEPYEEWLFLSGMAMPRDEDLPYRLRFLMLDPTWLTGLEVAHQPGLILVWIGFALMSVGTILSLYLNHRRVWVLIQAEGDESTLFLGGSSNRDRVGFEQTLKEWRRALEPGC